MKKKDRRRLKRLREIMRIRMRLLSEAIGQVADMLKQQRKPDAANRKRRR